MSFQGVSRLWLICFLRFQILVQHLCLQYSGTAIMCVLQVYSTCVFSTVLQHLCVQYSKRVGLKGPAQCIVPAGAHCLIYSECVLYTVAAAKQLPSHFFHNFVAFLLFSCIVFNVFLVFQSLSKVFGCWVAQYSIHLHSISLDFCNNDCSRIVWAIYTWEDNCRLVCQWWWCCNAFPVVGEVSQWPFSTLSWGPCTDLNGWFNLNLTTVTRLLAGIKQWTLLFSCIVQCFCMFSYSLSGTFPLACTLGLYSAGMPNKQCSTFQLLSTVHRGCS